MKRDNMEADSMIADAWVEQAEKQMAEAKEMTLDQLASENRRLEAENDRLKDLLERTELECDSWREIAFKLAD